MQRHGHFLGVRVLGDVGQRLLQDAIHIFADNGWHVAVFEHQFGADRHAGAMRVIAQVALHGVLQPQVIEQRRPDAGGDLVNAVQQMLGPVQGAADQVILFVAVRGLGGALEIERHGGDHLAHLIVQIAGDAAALLFLGRHELRRQRAQARFGLGKPALVLPAHGAGMAEIPRQPED